MSPQTWRVVIALVLFLHGIGHTMGALAALDIFDVDGWNAHSWLLSDRLGESATRNLALILFVVLCIAFVVTTLALLDWGIVPHDWWRSLAVVSAAVSTFTVIVYWNAFVALVPNKVGALAVNGAVLVGLVIANWPTEADIGL